MFNFNFSLFWGDFSPDASWRFVLGVNCDNLWLTYFSSPEALFQTAADKNRLFVTLNFISCWQIFKV